LIVVYFFKLRERVAKLSGKVATIYVAGNSEVEIKERKID
jgi:TCP-1/cpn60 chaperonin family.